jgi:hypothetical protein
MVGAGERTDLEPGPGSIPGGRPEPERAVGRFGEAPGAGEPVPFDGALLVSVDGSMPGSTCCGAVSVEPPAGSAVAVDGGAVVPVVARDGDPVAGEVVAVVAGLVVAVVAVGRVLAVGAVVAVVLVAVPAGGPDRVVSVVSALSVWSALSLLSVLSVLSLSLLDWRGLEDFGRDDDVVALSRSAAGSAGPGSARATPPPNDRLPTITRTPAPARA